MRRRARLAGHRTAVLLGAAAALGAAAGPGPAAAQQAEPGERPRAETGWLGLGLQEALACHRSVGQTAGPRSCQRVLHVEEVVVDGPADRVGIRPGDRLVAVAGRAVGAPSARAALSELRPGRAVRLRLAAPGGARTVRVVPARRPEARRPLRVRSADGEVRTVVVGAALRSRGPDAPEAPQGVVRPAPPGAPEEAPRGAWSLSIRTDSGGVVMVRRGAIVSRNVAELRVGEAEAWPPAGGTPEREVLPRSGGEWRVSFLPEVRAPSPLPVPAKPDSASGGGRFLELGPEFRPLRDSTLARARVRLDSVAVAWRRGEFPGRRDGPAGWAVRFRTGEAGEDAPAFGLLAQRRVAGAEFHPMNPALAEFFEAGERGLLVLRVLPETPADRAGLRPGDVLLEAGGRPVEAVEDLRDALAGPRASRPIPVRWIRKGAPMEGSIPGE